MPAIDALRRHITELVVVFVGVALAFAVENFREDLNERGVGDQYLQGFREDLMADLEMLQVEHAARRAQVKDAMVALEYFEGRTIEPQRFFDAYYSALLSRNTVPNRNTMVEVLSSGNLRLIRDAEIRSRLLELYVTYDRIARTEEHMSRDFDFYLYDPTFSGIRLQLEGPWKDTPENRNSVETLVNDLRVENGLRLLIANLEYEETGLLDDLKLARLQVEQLLALIPDE